MLIGETNMLTTNATSTPVRALVQGWLALARQFDAANDQDGIRRLKVYLESDIGLEDEIKSDEDVVQYVDDREEADLCMTVRPDLSHGGHQHLVRFVGAGPFAFIEASARLHLAHPRVVNFSRLHSDTASTLA